MLKVRGWEAKKDNDTSYVLFVIFHTLFSKGMNNFHIKY